MSTVVSSTGDYFSDSVPAKDADQRGLSRVASAISEARAAVGAESVLVISLYEYDGVPQCHHRAGGSLVACPAYRKFLPRFVDGAREDFGFYM